MKYTVVAVGSIASSSVAIAANLRAGTSNDYSKENESRSWMWHDYGKLDPEPTSYWLGDDNLPPWIKNHYHPGDEEIFPELGHPLYREMFIAGLDDIMVDESEDVLAADELDERRLQHLHSKKALVESSCNFSPEDVTLFDPMDQNKCTLWSSFISENMDNIIKIPCGSCITMDVLDGSQISLLYGLSIVGRLFIPNDASFEIVTPWIIVEGLLEIEASSEDRKIPSEKQIKFTLTGTENVSFTPDMATDNTNHCESGCNVGVKPFVVAGGRVMIKGMNDDCPTWTLLLYIGDADGEVNNIIRLKDPQAAKCWTTGAELLFTSDQTGLNGWDDDHIAVIDSVDTATGEIKLVSGLPKKKTSIEECEGCDDSDGFECNCENIAVEVAILSRNIIIQPDEVLDGIGNHFIVYHTPNVPQIIQGVEIKNSGQKGILGRYPLHFHMSESVFGSVVSKNSVRDSNQRCYVIHGSHNVTLSENVAYNNFGHCYMLEDGGEWDNLFQNNIGVRTKVLPIVDHPKHGLSDHFPSTFWITNPANEIIGNVAAGSQSSGIWFELRGINEPSKSLPINHGIDTRRLALGRFKDNVVHSNRGNGLALYPIGYFAPTGTTFENTYVYKNNGVGIFFHGVTNIKIDGGYIADNRIGMRNFAVANSILEDVTVVGVSKHLNYMINEGRVESFCHPNRHMYGVSFHPNEGIGHGTQFYNIDFSGFTDSNGCKTSNALWLENDQTRSHLFNNVQVFSDVTFDSITNRVTVCEAIHNSHDGDVTNIAIEANGISPYNRGFYLQDSGDQSLFKHLFDGGESCVAVDGSCLKYCADACLRLVIFETTGSSWTDDIQMVITDTATGIQSFDYKHMWRPSTNIVNKGFYGAALPAGKAFSVSFLQRGTKVWPDFVYEKYEVAPQCNVSLRPDITFDYPAPTSRCNQLIKNGDLEDGSYVGWQDFFTDFEMVSPGADGSDYAVKTVRRTVAGGHVSVHNMLDVSCLRGAQGFAYQIEGKIKILNSEEEMIACNPGASCSPRLTLKYETYNRQTSDRSAHIILREHLSTLSTGWASFSFHITLPDDIVEATQATLVLDQAAGYNFVLDNWSMEVEQTFSTFPTLSLNPSPMPSEAPSEMELINLSISKDATQSSIFRNRPSFAAEIAVNGNIDGTTEYTHTNCNETPWWKVDLGSSFELWKIVIYNRRDCCGGRLRQFDVKVLNDEMDETKVIYHSGAVGADIRLDLEGAIGRYVKISLRRQDCLSFAEVEVYGK